MSKKTDRQARPDNRDNGPKQDEQDQYAVLRALREQVSDDTDAFEDDLAEACQLARDLNQAAATISQRATHGNTADKERERLQSLCDRAVALADSADERIIEVIEEFFDGEAGSRRRFADACSSVFLADRGCSLSPEERLLNAVFHEDDKVREIVPRPEKCLNPEETGAAEAKGGEKEEGGEKPKKGCKSVAKAKTDNPENRK